MKNYRLLNDGETILETDLCYNFGRKWDTPQDTIGMPFNSKLIFPIKREDPPPQWQTGEIPEPTGLCVVVIEDELDQPTIIQSEKWEDWQWGVCGELEYTPNQMLLKAHTTGRWYIQPIAMPQPQPKLPPAGK